VDKTDFELLKLINVCFSALENEVEHYVKSR